MNWAVEVYGKLAGDPADVDAVTEAFKKTIAGLEKAGHTGIVLRVNGHTVVPEP